MAFFGECPIFRHAHMNRRMTTTTGYKRPSPTPRLHNGPGRCPSLQVQIQCCAHQVQQSRPSGHFLLWSRWRLHNSTIYSLFWLKGVVKQLLWCSQGSKTIGYVFGNLWRMCVGQDVRNRLVTTCVTCAALRHGVACTIPAMNTLPEESLCCVNFGTC